MFCPALLIKVFDGQLSPENILPISEMISQYSSCSFNICMDNMGRFQRQGHNYGTWCAISTIRSA